MLPKLSILVKAASAVVMIATLLFLTTANFWAYGFKKEKQTISSKATTSDNEQDSGSSVPNPVEEKNANTLQNLSAYLHDHHHHSITCFVTLSSFGNRHDIINLPIHHPDLLTPPPKHLG
jgi:hypothetical protein